MMGDADPVLEIELGDDVAVNVKGEFGLPKYAGAVNVTVA